MGKPRKEQAGQPFTDIAQLSPHNEPQVRHSPSGRAYAYQVTSREQPPLSGIDLERDPHHADRTGPYGTPLISPGILDATGQAPRHSTDDDSEREDESDRDDQVEDMSPEEMRAHIEELQKRKQELMEIRTILGALQDGTLDLNEFGPPEQQAQIVGMLEMYGHALLSDMQQGADLIASQAQKRGDGGTGGPRTTTTATSTSTATGMATQTSSISESEVTESAVPDTEDDDWSETGFTSEDRAEAPYEQQETSRYQQAQHQQQQELDDAFEEQQLLQELAKRRRELQEQQELHDRLSRQLAEQERISAQRQQMVERASQQVPDHHHHHHALQLQSSLPRRGHPMTEGEALIAAAANAGIDIAALAQNAIGVDPNVVNDVMGQISALQNLRDDIARLREEVTSTDANGNARDPQEMFEQIQARMAQVAQVSERIQELEGQLDAGRLATHQLQQFVDRIDEMEARAILEQAQSGEQELLSEEGESEYDDDDYETETEDDDIDDEALGIREDDNALDDTRSDLAVPDSHRHAIMNAQSAARPTTRGGTGVYLDRTSTRTPADNTSAIQFDFGGMMQDVLGGRGGRAGNRPSSAPAAPVDPRFGRRQHRAAMLAELASAKLRQENSENDFDERQQFTQERELSNDALDQYLDDRETPSPDLGNYPDRPAAPTPTQDRSYDRAVMTPSPGRLTRPQAPTPGAQQYVPSTLSSPQVSRPPSSSPRTAAQHSFRNPAPVDPNDASAYMDHLEDLLDHSRVSLEDLKLAVLYSSRLPHGAPRAEFFSTFFQYFEEIHGGRRSNQGDDESEVVTDDDGGGGGGRDSDAQQSSRRGSESSDQYALLSQAFQIRPGTTAEVARAAQDYDSESDTGVSEVSTSVSETLRDALGEEWEQVLRANAKNPEFLLLALMELRRLQDPRAREEALHFLHRVNADMLNLEQAQADQSTTMDESDTDATERTLDSAAENALERAIDREPSESDIPLASLDADLRITDQERGPEPRHHKTTKPRSAGRGPRGDQDRSRRSEFRDQLEQMEEERMQNLRQNYFIHNLTQLDSPNKVPSSSSSAATSITDGLGPFDTSGSESGEIRRRGGGGLRSSHGPEHDYSETAEESDVSLPMSQLESSDSRAQRGAEGLAELNAEYSTEIMENEIIVQAFHQKICSLWAQKEGAREGGHSGRKQWNEKGVDSSSAGGEDQGMTSASSVGDDPVVFEIEDIVDLTKRVSHLVSSNTSLMDTPLRKAIRACTSKYLGVDIGKYKDDMVQDVSDLLYDQMIFQKVVDHVTRSYDADIEALQASSKSPGREIAALKAQRDDDIRKLREERMQRLAMDNGDDALHRQDKDTFTTPSVWMQKYRDALSLAQRTQLPDDSGASTSSGTGEMDQTDNDSETDDADATTTDDMQSDDQSSMNPMLAQMSRDLDQVMASVDEALSPKKRRAGDTRQGRDDDFTDDSLNMISVNDLPDAPLNIPDGLDTSIDGSGVIEFSEQEPDSSFAVDGDDAWPPSHPNYQSEAREHIALALAEVTDGESEVEGTDDDSLAPGAEDDRGEPGFVAEARRHIQKALQDDSDDALFAQAKEQITRTLDEIEADFGIKDLVPHPDDFPVGTTASPARTSTVTGAQPSPARRAFVEQLREVEEQYASLGLKDVGSPKDDDNQSSPTGVISNSRMKVEPDRFLLARKTSDTIRAELAAKSKAFGQTQ